MAEWMIFFSNGIKLKPKKGKVVRVFIFVNLGLSESTDMTLLQSLSD